MPTLTERVSSKTLKPKNSSFSTTHSRVGKAQSILFIVCSRTSGRYSLPWTRAQHSNHQMKKEVFNQYAEKIAHMFGISREQMFSKSRDRNVVDARHLLYYMCSTRPMQLIYIQKFLEEEGFITKHPPLIHGVKVVTSRLKEDPDYNRIIQKLKESVTI